MKDTVIVDNDWDDEEKDTPCNSYELIKEPYSTVWKETGFKNLW